MKKKQNNKENINQTSFYFEDYLETNQKKKEDKNFSIVQDRIYLLFFLFLSLITIFSIKITLVSLKEPKLNILENNSIFQKSLRRDIVDRNGILVS